LIFIKVIIRAPGKLSEIPSVIKKIVLAIFHGIVDILKVRLLSVVINRGIQSTIEFLQAAFFAACSFIFGEETCERMKKWILEFAATVEEFFVKVSEKF